MSGIVIEFDEAKHKYTVNGEPVPSVTQILGVLDKSGALTWWAQKIGVEGVCKLRSWGVEIPWDDPDGIVKLLTAHKITTNHTKQKAGTRGTSLHTALEAWIADEIVPNTADYPDEDAGYVQALARAILELRPEITASEVMVASVKHGFAGRYDLRWHRLGRSARVDLKTGKRVYPESQFPQLEAYEGAAVEMGDDPTDERLILRLDASGEFEIARSYATFDDFLAIKAAWDATQRMRQARRELKAAA